MHMRGSPITMVGLAEYGDVVAEVAAKLAECVSRAEAAGIHRSSIALDPGIGFAKSVEGNIALLQGLSALQALGRPILVGVSRKQFVGTLSGVSEASDRVAGSIAAGLYALSQGASILRVHDVAATVQAVRLWRALTGWDMTTRKLEVNI